MVKIKNVGIRSLLNFGESISPGETKEVKQVDPVIKDKVKIIKVETKKSGGETKW